MAEPPEIIEGEFHVIGERPVRQPIIKSWKALWIMLGILALRAAHIWVKGHGGQF